MGFTLKGYGFDYTHTLAHTYKTVKNTLDFTLFFGNWSIYFCSHSCCLFVFLLSQSSLLWNQTRVQVCVCVSFECDPHYSSLEHIVTGQQWLKPKNVNHLTYLILFFLQSYGKHFITKATALEQQKKGICKNKKSRINKLQAKTFIFFQQKHYNEMPLKSKDCVKLACLFKWSWSLCILHETHLNFTVWRCGRRWRLTWLF